MRCSSCQADNREGRRFCAQCGAALTVACPACGFSNEAGEKFCGGCGKSLVTAPPVSAPFASVEAYTPKHLAERILTSKTALEGERKQVTVLFADLKGSMELLAGRDPEDARRLLDAVLSRMMEAVHRYEGTVNQVLGDGIMALFGAPLALEDHAVRACYAALAMQEAIDRYAQEGAEALGLAVNIRVGLNSGEVVVRAIGSDLHMDYTAIGQTTHLAARMEQQATPGTILLTAATARLAQGYVQVRPLGPIPVKGMPKPIEVFELAGVGASRTRLQVAAARGLSPLVGRQSELEALPRLLARAEQGSGQVVAVVGEPGVGKSRLFWEFLHSGLTAGWQVLHSAAESYSKAVTYLPVVEVLKAYFDIDERDDAARVREKVAAKQSHLGETMELTPLLALLRVPIDDPQWTSLDPPRRRQRTLDTVKRLILRESQIQPLILVFENLHWVDSETEAVLDSLVESMPKARLLLLVNCRPEYRHTWSGKSYYTHLGLHPLGHDSAEALLDSLLGPAAGLRPVKQMLIERAEGNPFFLEEGVRALVDGGVLAGDRGEYRLRRPLTDIAVPATVQAILAARIDRLSAEEKHLLQCASVVGRTVSLPLLQALAGLPEAEVRRCLIELQAREFLHEVSLYPELQYTFKHAVTHDVAYASLLLEHRRAFHARMVEAIEELYADRLAEHVEQLADHAFRGERWAKAVDYFEASGSKALTLSAHPAAVTAFEQALEALKHLPEDRRTRERAIDLRFDLRNSLWPLGQLEQLLEHLTRAEALAEEIGDQRRLGQVSAYMSQFFAWMGVHERAVEAGERALGIALDTGDTALEVAANFRLGQALYARGEYGRARGFLRRNIETLQGSQLHQRLGMTGLPSVMSRAWMAWCLSELGDFDEALPLGDEAQSIAEATNHPLDLVVAGFAGAIVRLARGDARQAIPLLERSLSLCDRGHVPFWFPLIGACLGSAYTLAGRASEAAPLLEIAVKRHAEMNLMGVHALLVAWHGEACLHDRRADEALDHGRSALELAQVHRERGHEAWAHRLLGEIARQSQPPDPEFAETSYLAGLGLAEELKMRPLAAQCRLGLAELCVARGDEAPAVSLLSEAMVGFAELGAGPWLQRTAPFVREMGRLLIVARDRAALYEILKEAFVETGDVDVILDRRQPSEVEELPPGENRRQSSIDVLLASSGLALVR